MPKLIEWLNGNNKYFLLSMLIYTGGIIIGFFAFDFLPATSAGGKTDPFLTRLSQPTALFFIVNNLKVAMALIIGGLLSFGIASAFILFVNGATLGESIAGAKTTITAWDVLIKLVPHGLFEVPAILLAATAGFSSLKVVIALLKERQIDWKGELINFGKLTLLTFVLLIGAGIIEANLTPFLIKLFLGEAN